MKRFLLAISLFFSIIFQNAVNAASPEPLVLYSAQGYDQTVASAFTKATGIPVKLTDDSTGPLLAKVAAEKNNPKWNLLWVDGDTAFAALDKQGQLATVTTNAALNNVGKALVPTDHSYVPTGVTTMAAFIYNSATLKNPPSTYQDLLKPQYRNLIGMNDPSQSGPTFPFIAGIFNQLGGEKSGIAKGEAFFASLKANGLKVFPTNGDTKHALESGQIQGGLIQSSAAQGEVLSFKLKPQKGYEPKVVYLPKSTLLPGVIGIDAKSSATALSEAKQFVNFVLSPAGQTAMQAGDSSGDSLYWPVVSGTSPLPSIPVLTSNYQVINPYFWGPQESQINSWFDSKIK
jgi:iron(III) transport system substrate-binding protein